MREWCTKVALAVADLSHRVAWAGPAVWEAPEVRQLWRTRELLQREAGEGSDEAVDKCSEQWCADCSTLSRSGTLCSALHTDGCMCLHAIDSLLRT